MTSFRALMNLIYPSRCHVCSDFLQDHPVHGGSGSICPVCYGDFRPIRSPRCSICSTPFSVETGDDHPCEECLRKRPAFQALHAPFVYEGAVMEAIHRFKYGGKSMLAESLGPILADFAENVIQITDGLSVMPVPLHLKRLRQRCFNQSLLLARHLSRRLNIELDFLSLRRHRYTTPQTGLGKEERRKNVKGAFRVEYPAAVKGKTVLLVDDVATTGNTLNECAEVLERSECRSVICLVLARA